MLEEADTYGSLADRLTALPGVRVSLSSTSLPKAGVDVWPRRLKTAPPRHPRQICAFPSTTLDAAEVLKVAAAGRHSVALRGRGSNVVGAIDESVDLLVGTNDLSQILSFDATSQLLSVGAGALGNAVEEFLNDRGYTTGIYPQSIGISTIGGWVNTRATGTHSARFGGIEHAVKGLVGVTAEGEVVRLGPRVRPAGGIDALGVLIGNEGSLLLLTEVTLAVHRIARERQVCASFPTFDAGLMAQRELVQRRIPLDLVRLYNEAETAAIVREGNPLGVTCLLMVTTSGEDDLADGQAKAVERVIQTTSGTLIDSAAGNGWYERRYVAANLMESANAAPGVMFDTIEVSAPWSSAVALAQGLEDELGPISSPFYLHSSHVYESGASLYAMVYLSAPDDESVVEQWSRCWSAAEVLVKRHAGSFGHHHGIGTVRARSYAQGFDAVAHRALKAALDPASTFRTPLTQHAPGRDPELEQTLEEPLNASTAGAAPDEERSLGRA